MLYHFPDKVSENRASLIREVSDRGSRIPGFVSFAIGNPAAETIPVKLIQECAEEVIHEQPMKILQYGPLNGEKKLVDWVEDRMVHYKGAIETGHKALMLIGSGRGLSLAPRTLCAEGDEAFCDAFSYPNSFNSMKNLGVIPVGIPMDDEGMLPDELEKQARRGKGKYLYLIPNFQNPTGRTMPLRRREEIYRVAREYDLIIYEDDPYGDIRFKGQEIPSFMNLDTDGRVVYAGSFSKTLSAGLRVGYLYGTDELMDKMAGVKNADGQDPIYSQMIIARCLKKMDFDAHLKKISAVYGDKCTLMLQRLREHCSDRCRITEPEGGMFVWVEMPEGTDMNRMSDAIIEAGVGAVRSEAFAVSPEETGHAFRLNFSAPDEEDILKGTERFGRITREYLDR